MTDITQAACSIMYDKIEHGVMCSCKIAFSQSVGSALETRLAVAGVCAKTPAWHSRTLAFMQGQLHDNFGDSLT